MKTIHLLLIALFTLTASALFAQSVQQRTETIKVYGKCTMCKNRIQKALKVDGIYDANWSPETMLLLVTYNPAKISNDAIQQKIIAIGHDTEKYRAEDKAYEALPSCCHYERKGSEANQEHSQHHSK